MGTTVQSARLPNPSSGTSAAAATRLDSAPGACCDVHSWRPSGARPEAVFPLPPILRMGDPRWMFHLPNRPRCPIYPCATLPHSESFGTRLVDACSCADDFGSGHTKRRLSEHRAVTGRVSHPQPTASFVSSVRQNVTSGGEVAPVACMTGPMSGCASSKNAWKLAASGHSSTAMNSPSAPYQRCAMSPRRLARSMIRPIASACAATCSSNAAGSPLTRTVTMIDMAPPRRRPRATLAHRADCEGRTLLSPRSSDLQPARQHARRSTTGCSSAPASLGVANRVVAVGEGLQPYRPAVTEGPDVGEAVVHLGPARLPAAALAHRCHDVSAELLDVEQLDGEIVEDVVALVEPLEQSLAAAIGLDRGPHDDVGGTERRDRPAVTPIDRRVDTRHELASPGHHPKAIDSPSPARRGTNGPVRLRGRVPVEARGRYPTLNVIRMFGWWIVQMILYVPRRVSFLLYVPERFVREWNRTGPRATVTLWGFLPSHSHSTVPLRFTRTVGVAPRRTK